VDLAINATRFKDDVLEQPISWKTPLRVVARIGHPRIHAEPSMTRLLAERLVLAHVASIRTDNEDLNDFLKQVCRQPAMEVPNAMLLPLVLEATDLVTVTTASLAEVMCKYHPVMAYPLPNPLDSAYLNSYMIWHRSMTADPAHRWLREQFQAVADTMMELTPHFF
jgi:DNA-binding transcriptional LysR family regulator